VYAIVNGGGLVAKRLGRPAAPASAGLAKLRSAVVGSIPAVGPLSSYIGQLSLQSLNLDKSSTGLSGWGEDGARSLLSGGRYGA